MVVAAALGVSAHSSLAEAQCTKDSDCKGERICEKGTCAEPAVQGAPAPPAAVTVWIAGVLSSSCRNDNPDSARVVPA